MELFAIKLQDDEICQIVENETMKIVGYLEQGEKGYYIHLQERRIFPIIESENSSKKCSLIEEGRINDL